MTGSPLIRLALALWISISLSCTTAQPTGDPAPAFGDLSGRVGEAQVAALVGWARDVLEAEGAPPAPPSALRGTPGRRVIVKAHAGNRSIAGSGLGADLAASTQQAVEVFKAKIKDPAAMRLEVLVIASFQPLVTGDDGGVSLDKAAVGIDGFAAVEGERFGFVLPSEVVTQELYELESSDFRFKAAKGMMAQRAGVHRPALAEGGPDHGPFALLTFRGLAMVEASPGGAAREVIRGLIDRPDPPTARELRQAARLAADYLVRNQDAKGHFEYLYEVAVDRPVSRDNSLVQAATGVAMWEAWDAFGERRYRAAAEKAARWAQGELKTDVKGVKLDPGNAGLRYLLDKTLAKTGGSARALSSLVRAIQAGSSAAEMDAALGLGRYLLQVQKPDGAIASYFKYAPDAPTAGDRGQYIGSAIHALVELYELTGDKRWLDGAVKAGDSVLKSDAKKPPARMNADYWLIRALARLSRTTGDPRYGDHGARAASAIPAGQIARGKASRDFVGGFGDPPLTMPAAEDIIALTEAAAWLKHEGKDASQLQESALAAAHFISRHQLDDVGAYFALDPERIKGGVRQGFSSNQIRVDYVHKWLSASLRLAALLSDKPLPGWPAQEAGAEDGADAPPTGGEEPAADPHP